MVNGLYVANQSGYLWERNTTNIFFPVQAPHTIHPAWCTGRWRFYLTVHWSVTVQSDSALAQAKEGFQCLEYRFWLLKCDITSLVASQLFHIVKLLMPLCFQLGFWNKICLCRVIPWKRSVPEISAFFLPREWWEGHLFQECPALRVLPDIQHWHNFFPFCSVISGRYLPVIHEKNGQKTGQACWKVKCSLKKMDTSP